MIAINSTTLQFLNVNIYVVNKDLYVVFLKHLFN